MAYSLTTKLRTSPSLKATLVACLAAFFYFLIACNYGCLSTRGMTGYALADTRLSAIVEIFWYLLPLVWLSVIYGAGKRWVKIMSALGMLLVTACAGIYIAIAFERVATDKDPRRVVIDISPVDSKTDECLYRSEPAFGSYFRIGCTETKLLPGLIRVKITEINSLSDYWVPVLPVYSR